MVRDATAFVAGGTRARDKLVELGAAPERIFNVYHTNVEARPGPPAPGDGGFVLYVGRLDERKGVEYLIRAFSRVRGRRPGLRLKIAGVGGRREALGRLSETLHVADAVEFLGWVDHGAVDALYRDCALFVLPSIFGPDGGYEPFSNVVLEAMAWGRPVVSTTANGASFDVVADGINGMVVPDRDVEALAAAIEWILDDPARAAAMGRRAWETIRRDFNVDRMAERFTAALAFVQAGREAATRAATPAG
jgi:glycosyltransferase involved in cell wall biosynthesis